MSKLQPLPSELDGEKETVELNFKRCSHKDAKIINNELKCKCGVGWTGPNLHHLQKLLQG